MISREKEDNQRGRPVNQRYPFQKQHPQANTYVLMKYSESHVPILYGPQIPRQDRADTRERYCRALLTLFIPWGTLLIFVPSTKHGKMLLSVDKITSPFTHERL